MNYELNKGPRCLNVARILVKNVMAASVTPPPAGYVSRLEYWESVTGEKASKCAHEVCERPATEAGIATRVFSADRTRYVYPACETCARRTEMLYISGPLVCVGG